METPVEEQQPQQPDDVARTLAGNKPRRPITRTLKDIAVIVAILAVVAGLAGFIFYRLNLKHDVDAAMKTTDKVIAAVANKNGQAAYDLGNAKFKKTYSAADLAKQFTTIEMVTGGKPTVDGESLVSKNGEKIVFITYKYPPKLANRPFYILVGVTKQPDGNWKLTDISGSADKSRLLSQ